MQNESDKILVVIDGYNLYYAMRALVAAEGLPPEHLCYDMFRLAENVLGMDGSRIGHLYYCSAPYRNNPAGKKVQGIYVGFHENLYRERFKAIYGRFDNDGREKRTDINIAVEIIFSMFGPDDYDRAVLFSGDNDFDPLIKLPKRCDGDKEIQRIRPGQTDRGLWPQYLRDSCFITELDKPTSREVAKYLKGAVGREKRRQAKART